MNTTSLLSMLVLLVSAPACAGAAPSPGSPSLPSPSASVMPSMTPKQALILQKIETFLADPASGDLASIGRYARESDDVLVVFRQSLLPLDDMTKDEGALLLAAFTAGNVRAQLKAGAKKDSPVDGTRAMLEVYRWAKARKPGFRIAKLEELAGHEAKGDLEAHVSGLVAHEPARP